MLAEVADRAGQHREDHRGECHGERRMDGHVEADGQQGNRDAGAAGTDKANQGAEDEHGGKQHEDHPFKQKSQERLHPGCYLQW